MKVAIILLAALTGLTGEQALNDISDRYREADGIQWQMRSIVFSEVFEDAETTFVDFSFAPPDTFALMGDNEKIIGIADTIWVLSERHKQIQKKLVDGSAMPSDYVINWNENYDMDSYVKEGSDSVFKLKGKEGVKPAALGLTVNNKKRIKSISYPDSKGDKVTISVLREKLNRPKIDNLFYLNIPDGYDFIDLTGE